MANPNPRISKKPRVARQYELSQAHIENNSIDSDITRTYVPGGLPDMPAEGLAPDNRPHVNRGRETSKNDSKAKEIYLGLETIDEAIFYYFENVIKPSVISNGSMIDVPVIYGSGERWKLAQKDGFYRDKGGKVQTPLVMLKRESIEKRRDLGNKLDANNPQLYVTYQEKFTKRNQYDQFSLLTNRIPQKEYTATVVPDYINLTYQGIIWTDYISQLNRIIEAINYASDAYWGDAEKFKFMAQIDQFTNITEVNNDDNRIVRANFSIKLQGYVVPENIQKKLREQNTRYFSKAQLVLNEGIVSTKGAPSTRAKQLTTTGGGGSFSSVFTQTTNTTEANVTVTTEIDDDWIIKDDYIIANKRAIVNLPTGDGDIFLIQRDGVTKASFNNEGIFTLATITDPNAVKGGFHFDGNNFYLGF